MAKSDIITRAKIESDQWTRGMRGMQADLDKFRSKSKGMTTEAAAMNKVLGTLKGGFGALAGALGVGLSAMEAFNKTVQSSEQFVDLMGRSMQQVNAVVDSFFASLSSGDFSTFINGLDDVARHARDAYNAVDALGTLKMFQRPQTARIAADIAEQRAIIRNPNATTEQKRAAQARLDSLTKEMYQMSGELQKQASDAFRASIRSALVSQGAHGINNRDIDEFVTKNLGSMEAFTAMRKRLAEYEEQIRANQVRKTSVVATGPGTSTYTSTWEDTDASRVLKSAAIYKLMKAAATMNEKKMAEAFGYAVEAENARGAAANTAAGAYRLMNANVGGTSRGKGKATPAATGPGYVGLMDFDALRARLKAEVARAFDEGMKGSARNITPMGIWQPEEYQATDDVLARMKEKQEVYATTTAKIQQLQQALQYATEAERPFLEQNINVLKNMAESADPAAAKMEKFAKQADSLNAVASAASAIGSAFSSTGNKTMSAVGSMIGTFSGLISTYASLKAAALQAGVAQSGAMPPPYNIIMIASTVAALASAMSTVSSFAQGGIVGGANFRDGISARVSSGEMIINEADQHRLFDDIHNGVARGGGGNSYISGEQIVTVVNAYGRRTGRGELIK